MKRRILIAATAAVMILGMAITGCSANAPRSVENYDSSYKNDSPDSFGIGYGTYYSTSESINTDSDDAPADEPSLMPDPDTPHTNNEQAQHKIIKNANVTIETRSFDEDINFIKEKAEELGGYIESESVSGRKPQEYGDGTRYAIITFRIPADKLNTFLTLAEGAATVTDKHISSDDVTTQYYDTDARREMYETQRDRVMELLKKAESMEDILMLENELTRINYEIDSLTTQLRSWDRLVDYSTVCMDVYELSPDRPSTTTDDFSTKVSVGFKSTLTGLGKFFEGFAIFMISASPVIAVLAAVAIAVIVIVKLCRKRRAKKRAAAAAKTDGMDKKEE